MVICDSHNFAIGMFLSDKFVQSASYASFSHTSEFMELPVCAIYRKESPHEAIAI